VFVVLLGFLATSLVVIHFIPNNPSRWKTELYTYQFAASAERFAFLDVEGTEKSDLVVYSPQERKLTIYRPQSAAIWSLSANPAKNGDFFVSYWRPITPDQFRSGEQVAMKLLRCRIGGCAAFFDFPGSINSAIDLGNDELIFIGATPQITRRGWPGSREFVGFPSVDFHFRSREGHIERITNWKAVFSSASLGRDRILFNFFPLPGSPTPQPPAYPRTSDIWAAKITFDDDMPRLAFEGDLPFIAHGKHLDTKASIAPDGSKTAFLSSTGYTATNQWRYDVAVLDNVSKGELFTVVPDEGTKLSLPVFVDNDHVRFMSFDGQRYSFREISVSAKQEKLLGQVTPADILRAEVVYLEDPQEVH
jgi:hypothetical protein